MSRTPPIDWVVTAAIFFLIIFSFFILKSLMPSLFPGYFMILTIGIIAFIIFSLLDFEILAIFSRHFYVIGIFILLLTLIIGQVTRGVVRWLPLGVFSLQAAEIVKPFFLVFMADYLYRGHMNKQKIIKVIFLAIFPVFLIFIQPSLGVSFLLGIGFLGAFLASYFPKKVILGAVIALMVAIPVVWYFLAPYQKDRLQFFIRPERDPFGKGYNAIQSQIAVGSGGFWGKGLGKGVQTQLAFLPEKQTDFIFASIAEELGFFGASLVIFAYFVLLARICDFAKIAINPQARAYITGLFFTLSAQIVIHIGMNLGLIPITGVPLPLLSAGGSSFVAVMIGLGIANGARKR